MAYNEEQLNATVTYILNFFRSEIEKKQTTVVSNNLSIFQSNLERIFARELPLYNPENFALHKNSTNERYFIEWIEKNILPFPDDFSVVISNDGNSFAMHGKIKTPIYTPQPILNGSVNMSIGSDSMSICSSSTSSPEKNSSTPIVPIHPIKSAYIPSDSQPSSNLTFIQMSKPVPVEPVVDTEVEIDPENGNELQKRNYFNSHYESFYEYLKVTQKKEGERHVFFDYSSIDKNNIYQDNEQPKYDTNTRGMYIPIYKKNKYGDVYRTMRATVAETISTPTSTPTIAQKTDLEIFQMEYEELTNNLNNLRIS